MNLSPHLFAASYVGQGAVALLAIFVLAGVHAPRPAPADLHVGASALVLETHTSAERNKVQAFNDFLVFGTMAIGSFSSGQILANSGWSAVNLVVFPPVAIALAALLLLSRRTACEP